MKRILSSLSAALAVLFLALSVLPAAAQSASSGLSITPRKDLTIRAGQNVSDKLIIGNLSSSSDLNVTLKVIDFTFRDETGTPKLMLADNAPQTPWSLKPFFKLPSSVVVPAGQQKSIDYSISIPANQGAGTYYSAIEYVATGPNGGKVNISASGVTLVFVSVPGVVRENMDLQKFGAYTSNDNGVTGTYVYFATQKAPQMIAYALKNTGNVAESPSGSIIVRDMFNHTVRSIDNANIHSQLALIGQERLFLACIQLSPDSQQAAVTGNGTTKCTDPHLKPGRYTASLDVFYGQNGNQTHEITGTTTFWYLPWWFLLAVVAGLVAVVVIIWFVVRKIRGGGKKNLSHIRR